MFRSVWCDLDFVFPVELPYTFLYDFIRSSSERRGKNEFIRARSIGSIAFDMGIAGKVDFSFDHGDFFEGETDVKELEIAREAVAITMDEVFRDESFTEDTRLGRAKPPVATFCRF